MNSSKTVPVDDNPTLVQAGRPLADRSGLITGLHSGDAALVFASLFTQSPGHYAWICASNSDVERVVADLRFFLPSPWSARVIAVPGSEAEFYRGLSPHPDILASRALGLWRLSQSDAAIVVTTLKSWMARLPSREGFLNHCMRYQAGDFVPRDHLLERLREVGYVREEPVSDVGEFSVRGGIVDVYSPAASNPYRIDFFGDEIEAIREFDPSTQRSIRLATQCEIVPMREMPVTKREVQQWHERAPEHWSEVRFAPALREKRQFTENQELFNGFEAVFPLVIRTDCHLLDYRPGGGRPWTVVVDGVQSFLKGIQERMANLRQEYAKRDESGELALPPEALFWTRGQCEERFAQSRAFQIGTLDETGGAAVRFDFAPERNYHGRLPELVADISKWTSSGSRVICVMSTRGTAERMADILREYEIEPQIAHDFARVQGSVCVTVGRLSEGFSSPSLRLHVITQDQVFESRLRPVTRTQRKKDIAAPFASDFRDLHEGDYVVHIEHGIGQFRGLKQIGVGDAMKEFVLVVYRGDAKLYVPIDRLDVLQKYSGSGSITPELDRLGGTSWEKTKSRIRRSMRDMAEDLLKLYARRAVAKGHAFPKDDDLMREFEEAFEYDETEDQAAAIKAVKEDMESDRPMDRLICGDVGYGKTEVAMRAAFKAVNDSRQIAVLAPTTVLAFQHFTTFTERFQGFPVAIEMISRFRSGKEQKEILEKCGQGSIDILIGTHRLLSKDVRFSRLGLLIVDEEQRFGVAQKERLKRLKTQVDVLTLSATPIPRTLNMSLVGIRDLSIIETPPKDRLAVQTVVMRYSRDLIRSAIDLELNRKGQVFFLHNSVETIHSIAAMVQETVPESRVAVAHGQLSERTLEEVMLGFLNHAFDVLVCTTIIENGLDIPRANTLIVNRADHFGLAQLYQLRGRIGRSYRRAYAYFLIPDEESLTETARLRLKAIREFSDLGAGFRIAALDMEIRGAGNLLGGEQHGQINAVGFELYTKLLDETIRELKGEPLEQEIETSIDLQMSIQIPDHYIEDSASRLWLYKRVASAKDDRALQAIREECSDRHGRPPRSVSNLFEYAKLRLKARELRILAVERKGGRVFFKFNPDTPLSPRKVVDFVTSQAGAALDGEGTLSMALPQESGVVEAVEAILDNLAVLQ